MIFSPIRMGISFTQIGILNYMWMLDDADQARHYLAKAIYITSVVHILVELIRARVAKDLDLV